MTLDERFDFERISEMAELLRECKALFLEIYHLLSRFITDVSSRDIDTVEQFIDSVRDRGTMDVMDVKILDAFLREAISVIYNKVLNNKDLQLTYKSELMKIEDLYDEILEHRKELMELFD